MKRDDVVWRCMFYAKAWQSEDNLYSQRNHLTLQVFQEGAEHVLYSFLKRNFDVVVAGEGTGYGYIQTLKPSDTSHRPIYILHYRQGLVFSLVSRLLAYCQFTNCEYADFQASGQAPLSYMHQMHLK